jgi:ankyrin repeat protein
MLSLLFKRYLLPGFNANYTDENGMTALMLAVNKEHVELAKSLVASGADINAQMPSNGFSPLLLACDGKNIALIEYFLSLSMRLFFSNYLLITNLLDNCNVTLATTTNRVNVLMYLCSWVGISEEIREKLVRVVLQKNNSDSFLNAQNKDGTLN